MFSKTQGRLYSLCWITLGIMKTRLSPQCSLCMLNALIILSIKACFIIIAVLGRSKVGFLRQSMIREVWVQKVICIQMLPKLFVCNFLLLLSVYYTLLSDNLNEVKTLWTPLTDCITFWKYQYLMCILECGREVMENMLRL